MMKPRDVLDRSRQVDARDEVASVSDSMERSLLVYDRYTVVAGHEGLARQACEGME